MSRNIWITSDTHLSHSNILKFTDSTTGELIRGNRFSNVDEMDQCILDNWNSVVNPGDIVYHLGDVTFDKEKFAKMWPRFNGSKRLIVGNHDDIKFMSSGGFFKKVQMWRMFSEFGLILSHVPLHITSMYRGAVDRPLYGIHGHIHQNSSPIGPYRNVCVEMTDYTPVHIEDLALKGQSYFNTQWETDKEKITTETK